MTPFPIASPFEREAVDDHATAAATTATNSSSSSSSIRAKSSKKETSAIGGSDSDDGFWSDVPTTTVALPAEVAKNKKQAGKASASASQRSHTNRSSSNSKRRGSLTHAQELEARALSHDQQRRAHALSRGALTSDQLTEASLLALSGVALPLPTSGADQSDRRGRIKVAGPMAMAVDQAMSQAASRGSSSSKRRVSESGFMSGSDESVGGGGRGSGHDDDDHQGALFPDFGSGQGAPFYEPSASALPLMATVERAHLGAGASGSMGHARGALGAPGSVVEGEVPRSVNR